MENRNKLTVKIANKSYTLVSENSREYMLEVSDFVDQHIKQINELSPCMSAEMVAVLAALNITDEYFKSKKEYELANNKIIEYTKKLEQLQAELDELKK